MTPIVFCELIMDYPGISILRDKLDSGIAAKLLMGKKDLPVIIDNTEPDDDIDYEIGRGYLKELGYEELSDVIFPIPQFAPPPNMPPGYEKD